MPPQGQDVVVTRLHARYDAESAPKDLRLLETGDRQNFQGRYVIRHPSQGEPGCAGAERYLASLPDRFEREAQTLVNRTGWEIPEIREAMKASGAQPAGGDSIPWWKTLWDED